MKAMVLEKLGKIEQSPLKLKKLPIPEPGEGEIRIKVRCCAICRTDLHVIEGDLPQQKLPIIPGHQIIGEVDALGSNCRTRQLGERVGVAWLRDTCGQCEFCRRGQENLCPQSRFTGYHANGGYAEYCIVSESFAYLVPQGFEDAEPAPLLCAGIIGYRALKRSCLLPGGSLAIFGFGSSAHVVMQIAQHRGCPVFVVSRGKNHQQLARELGAKWVGKSANAMPEKVDSAIVFAPAGSLVPQALGVLKKGGTLALAGIVMSPIPELDYEKHLFYERNVHSVTANTREDARELLAEAAAIPIRAHTQRYPLSKANEALQDLKKDKIKGSGVLIMK